MTNMMARRRRRTPQIKSVRLKVARPDSFDRSAIGNRFSLIPRRNGSYHRRAARGYPDRHRDPFHCEATSSGNLASSSTTDSVGKV